MNPQFYQEAFAGSPSTFVTRPTVFVATGDADLRADLELMLGAEGATVISFPDGFHLVEQLAEPILASDFSANGRPDLIIADAILPGCTGLSLVAGLRDLRWGTPVILITGDHRDLKRARALDGGVTSFFLRPFDCEELCAYATLLLCRNAKQSQQQTEVPVRSERQRLARGTRDMPAPTWAELE